MEQQRMINAKEVLRFAAACHDCYNWKIGENGHIHAQSLEGELCPITAVCYAIKGKYHPPEQWALAAKDIGLPHDEATKLMDASRGLKGHDPELRKQVEKILVRRSL